MGKLHVCTADHLHFFHNFIRLSLQLLLHILGNRQHRSGTEGVSCVNAQRVDIFDKAYGNHIVFGVADNFQLELFPAENGLLHQHLTHKACLKASRAYGL